ncbi:hypothetical protein J2Z19_003730 [Ensifer adhaerens]|uniref:Uncharacterized protein n=1 Tax=Ensifer adhaerens TaxID=106592 RepID=A0ACC5SYN4_ENSAD|nr:hypothetical protein [Ensifer adhaerens]MBP1874011.1 hypothetical protein [Ensifer adhaerens]
MSERGNAPGQSLGKTGIVIGIWAAAGALPLLAKMFGIQFLPSTEWLNRTFLVGICAGLFSGGGAVWIVARRLSSIPGGGEVRKAVAVIGAPFLGYFVGRHAVVYAGPMIIALVAGAQVELSFTVADANRHYSSRCPSSIELQGFPIIFNRLCGVPEEVRRNLSSGKEIIVSGRGTGLGVYVDRLRPGDWTVAPLLRSL